MKKASFAVAVAMAATTLTGCLDGSVDTNSMPLVQPTHEYEVDTWGFNSEVYEFTPRSNKNKTCVMFMLDSGAAMGLECFDKPAKK